MADSPTWSLPRSQPCAEDLRGDTRLCGLWLASIRSGGLHGCQTGSVIRLWVGEKQFGGAALSVLMAIQMVVGGEAYLINYLGPRGGFREKRDRSCSPLKPPRVARCSRCCYSIWLGLPGLVLPPAVMWQLPFLRLIASRWTTRELATFAASPLRVLQARTLIARAAVSARRNSHLSDQSYELLVFRCAGGLRGWSGGHDGAAFHRPIWWSASNSAPCSVRGRVLSNVEPLVRQPPPGTGRSRQMRDAGPSQFAPKHRIHPVWVRLFPIIFFLPSSQSRFCFLRSGRGPTRFRTEQSSIPSSPPPTSRCSWAT